ncbi:MetQ/NlpA family ABC transporter substrate-binding protein [Mycobacterium sp. NPDC050041]|uniref:MetQ/NlpA family ABC transporter substrate-binding protein n=1 Tax=Mycobacterium sp. NPDC050041 TaxID=3364293 RepID=UPI003C303B62
MSRTVRSIAGVGMRPLRVAASPVPHAEILEHVQPMLAGHGVDLRIETFESFDEPNDLVAAHRLDANYFQYLPFLAEFNRRTGAGLVPITPVHIEPFGLYSAVWPGLADIPRFAEIALPSDPVNIGRALEMLAGEDMIEVKRSGAAPATIADVTHNPRELVLKELSSWLLADVLADFDAAFLFGNQAMGRGVPTGAALVFDHGNPAYAEYLVARPDNCEDADIRLLGAALNCASTRAFIGAAYRGQVIAAF